MDAADGRLEPHRTTEELDVVMIVTRRTVLELDERRLQGDPADDPQHRGHGADSALGGDRSTSAVVRAPDERERRTIGFVDELVAEGVAEHEDVAGQSFESRPKGGGGLDRRIRAKLTSLVTRQRLTTFVAREDADHLERLADLVETGHVTPVVDRTFPLSRAAYAILHLESGRTRGKVAIAVDNREPQ